MYSTEQATGLQSLSDELLSTIVENDIDGYGELRSEEARIAFAELSRRSVE